MHRRSLVLAALLTPWRAFASEGLEHVLMDGDIVLHKSTSAQSAALREATGSAYTHVGIAFQRSGAWHVLEAVQPVRWTPIHAWVDRGADHHVVTLRLRDDAALRADATPLRSAATAFLGRPYDTLFDWSDDAIYCSELVYKAYDAALHVQVGTLAPLATFDLTGPHTRALIAKRARAGLDLTREAVAPASLLTDTDLRVVYSSDPEVTLPSPALHHDAP